MDYSEFLASKQLRRKSCGFEPTFLPDGMKDFQKFLTGWSVRQGRSAMLVDCGGGKTYMQLVWAENCLRHVGKLSRALILTPLAVARQTVKEAAKFGLKATQVRDGEITKGINVTNYEQLSKYSPEDFAACVCDEASCLKGTDSKRRKQITQFMAQVNYRLLCTATPAPNDFMELGTLSEAMGIMTRNQMLAMFFTNDGESTQQWRLKGHAKKRFWQWVASWARAARKPSDLGDFDDTGYVLPKLNMHHQIVPSKQPSRGFLPFVAKTLNEQRQERRDTLKERCEKIASLMPKDRPAVVWCQLNSEGELLNRMISGSVEVAGRHPDSLKEDRLIGFTEGKYRILISKSKIAGYGLNLQHCSTVFYMPTDSHEQFYQAIRRCWRYGQPNEVDCHIVSSSGEKRVVENMLRKERASDELFQGVVREMSSVLSEKAECNGHTKVRLPRWL